MPLESIAVITTAWGCLAYFMMPWGPTAGATKQNEAQIKFGDRCFMNLIEQAPLFLSSLWTCAVYASEETATNVGTGYLVLRALYPVVWLFKGGSTPGFPMPAGMLVAVPACACNMYMSACVIAKCAFEFDLAFGGWMDAAAVFGFCVVFLFHAMKVCPCLHSVFKHAFTGAPLL